MIQAKIKTVGFERAHRHISRLMGAVRDAQDDVAREAAELLAKDMRQGLERQAPGGRQLRPPSAATLMARRMAGISSRRALIASGSLLGSIKARRVRRGHWHAGVDQEHDWLANLHERGFGPVAVRMTPAMRRYLFGVVFRGQPRRQGSGRPGIVVLKVPARPFVGPSAEAFRRSGARRQALTRAYAKALKGLVGPVRG